MDNKYVKKIMTFKSGSFVFSGKYSEKRLHDSLLGAEIFTKTVCELPTLPEMVSKINEELIRRSIFGTAALEGNPLTEERVEEVILASDTGRTKEQAETEIQNLKKTYDFVENLKKDTPPFKLNEKLIKKIHALITADIDYKQNIPGTYRNHIVKVGDNEHGGIYTPPKCLDDIKKLMSEFIQWINSKEILGLNPIIRAGLAHYHFGLIHPFADGNGRTARIIEALILQGEGIKYVPIMLSNFYYKHLDQYFSVFSTTRKNKENNITDFLEFVLTAFLVSVKEINDKITFWIRFFLLRDHYFYLKQEKDLTDRQFDFLNTALETFKPFTLKDLFITLPFKPLYRNVSERTARRDLEKLHDMKLLEKKDEKYIINYKAIG